MGEPTFLERVKEFVGSIGWWLFIWAYYDGDEETYHDAHEQDLLRHRSGSYDPRKLYVATFNLPNIRAAIKERGLERIVDDITAGVAKAIRNVERHPEGIETIETIGMLGVDDKED